MNDPLRQWVQDHRDEFLHALMQHEAPLRADQVCPCGAKALWRCTDCHCALELCSQCLINDHRHLPFHRVEKWSIDGFFARSSLRDAGLVLYAGHQGDRCPFYNSQDDAMDCDSSPSVVPTPPTPLEESDPLPEELQDSKDNQTDDVQLSRRFFIPPPGYDKYGNNVLTVVDLSGVHFLAVGFCKCHNSQSHYRQLLDMKLFPATFRRVKTAFTFNVLDDFLLISRVSKISVSSYYTILRRWTNSSFPHLVPVRIIIPLLSNLLIMCQDCYRELMRVIRQWRDLKHRKWRGFAHSDERPIPKGGLALFCPACPQAGINLPEDWQSDRERYVLMPA